MSLIPVTIFGNQLTASELSFVQNLAGLSYVQGDILYYNGTSLTRLGYGTSGYFLKTNGVGANPAWADASGGSGANTALSNLASVAINTTLVSDTDNTDALGTAAIGWSDIFLGNGAVITFSTAPSTADITITHSADTLTFAGGTIVLGTATATGGLTGNVTGNVSGTAATVTGAAQTNITSLGTLTVLQVDNLNLNGNTIISTDTNGNINLTPDGTGKNILANAQITSLTASEIVITDASKNLVSAAVATYPSLTELTYLKGVSSAIQTQLNAKGVGDMVLASVQSVTGLKTFDTTKLAVKGSSTGSTAIASANAGASDYTQTLQARDGTVANLDNVTYIGTTSVALNRTSAALTLAGITLTTPDIGTPSAGTLTNCTGLPASGIVSGTTPASTVITLGENSAIALDPAGSADGKYTGITITGTSDYTQAFGDLVYLKASNSRWAATDADASATGGPVMIGMVVVTGTSGNACTILLQGQIRADAKFPALTVGAPVYLGETAGEIQVAIPTGADNVIRVVGFALTADEIYFNPSQDHQISVA